MSLQSWQRGDCADCGRPMVGQVPWDRNPELRVGRVKFNGLGLCLVCYTRARRRGKLPRLPQVRVYPKAQVVECAACGPVAEVATRSEAAQLRAEHLASAHPARVPTPERPVRAPRREKPRLSEETLLRLRQAVGLVAS
jgi:hypothetical protein